MPGSSVPFSPEAVVALLPSVPVPPPWVAGPTEDYTARSPGLGVSLRYEAPFGHVDLYVYDAQQTGLRAGLDDQRSREQFATAVGDIDLARQRGLYDSVQLLSAAPEALEGNPWFHATLNLVRRGEGVESHVFLRVDHGHFLKVRASIAAPASDDVRASVRALIVDRHNALLRLFGPSPGEGAPRRGVRL